MNDWFETLDGLLDRTWHLLNRGTQEANHPMHLTALATAGLGGGAEARMVVLRGANRSDAHLEVQTDRASRKVDELQANPLATLLFWAPEQSLQIRARVRVTVLTGDTVESRWQALPDHARRNYGGQPAPSTPLPEATDYRETAERDRFAVLSCAVEALDVVHLGALHRRAVFEARDGFAGMWLAP